jgi:hypothetical protein
MSELDVRAGNAFAAAAFPASKRMHATWVGSRVLGHWTSLDVVVPTQHVSADAWVSGVR